MADIIFRYDPTKHQRPGEFLAGVPMRDLTTDDLARLPQHLVDSIAAAAFFVKQAPKRKRRAKKEN